MSDSQDKQTYALEYTQAKNEKGTLYHWLRVVKRVPGAAPGTFEISGRVFVIRAWGKKPSQSKAMTFMSSLQSERYFDKWREGKEIVQGLVEIAQSESLSKIVEEISSSFPWVNLSEHKEKFDQAFGGEAPDVGLYTPKARVKPPAKQGQTIQQALSKLPATYGWW